MRNRTYFTFGPGHESVKVPRPLDQHVVVEAPPSIDARTVFMLWLGSNAFAFQYDEPDWNEHMVKYGTVPAAVITVDVEEVG